MRESNVCTEIVKTFNENDCFAFKIPDMPHFAGQQTRFDIKKPFDILAFIGERGVAIEVKLFKKYQKLSSRHLRPNQIEALDKLVKQNAPAYLFLNVRIPRTVNRLYVFDWLKFGKKISTTGIEREKIQNMEYFKGSKGVFKLESFIREVRHF